MKAPTETQIVKRLVKALKRERRHHVRYHRRNRRFGVWIAAAADLSGTGSAWAYQYRGRWHVRDIRRGLVQNPAHVNTTSAKRIARRAEKKARQPYRRVDRGPMRARGSGKGEVRPSRARRQS